MIVERDHALILLAFAQLAAKVVGKLRNLYRTHVHGGIPRVSPETVLLAYVLCKSTDAALS
jgi:hypothetical protein